MKKPNVFILGAPKCGTTSLSNWLVEHPQVFFSPIKEPHFFNYDYGFRRALTLSQYESLFAGADDSHHAVCEASVRYLYSRTAVPAILAYVKNPKFVVMVRNPVEMAASLHEQTLFNGDEDIPDFERAWRIQGERLYGSLLPKHCKDPQLLQYGILCKLGKQVERLYKMVPREQVHLIHLEKLRSSPRTEWVRLQSFLEIEDDFRNTFPVANTAKVRRFPWVMRCMHKANSLIRALGVPYIRIGLTNYVNSQLARERPRYPMSKDLRLELEEYFAEDQKLLHRLGHCVARQEPMS